MGNLFTHSHVHQVIAAACRRNIATSKSSEKFIISKGPRLLVTMTLGGSLNTLTAARVTRPMGQQLVAVVAEIAQVPPLVVQMVSAQDNTRRLLAVSVVFQMYLASADEVPKYTEKILNANAQV
jgi:hypothetical protein